jgi:predicted neuraminidase
MRAAVWAVLGVVMLRASPAPEFIYESAPFLSAHASTIVETAPGELLAAWFGGSAEGRPDVGIWGARRAQGKWSAPVELAREPGIASYNPVLFHSADGLLWLYYKFGPSPSQWTGARRSSRDGGRTWSAVDHLPAGLYGPIKNKPLLLEDGTLVAGSSVESYRAWTSWVERSVDQGRTWTRHGPVVYPGVEDGTIQPAVVALGGKRLRLFVRSTERIGAICYADSEDAGLTWSELKRTPLENPNSGIDAARLRDGRIVIVYNPSRSDRTPLSLAVSRDGLKWRRALDLETGAGEYSYPAIIQASDGSLHVTYTWKRQRIRHVEIPLSEIPKGDSK